MSSLSELRSSISIVDERGRPTPDFIRRWDEFVSGVEQTTTTERQARVNQAQQIIRTERRVDDLPDIVWVDRASDLDPYLQGDVYVLPGKLVVPTQIIDIADKAIEVSTGTVINGLSKGGFMSSNTGGLLRSTVAVASAVIVHNTVLIASAGPVLALTGPIDQQLNLDFVGLFGASAGTITGFDVSSVKSCFVEAGDGITYTGTTNKIFVQASPFYAIAGAAVRFAAALNCGVVHIESCFFKYDLPGKGIEAVAGYTVNRGLLINSLKQGSVDMFVGLSPADVQWDMRNNQGVEDSSVIGAFVQDVGEETTVIAAMDTPTLANLTTTPSAFNERFEHTDNRLTYTGLDPVTVLIIGSTSMGSISPNQDARMWAALNGSPLMTARMRAELRGGGDTDPVTLAGVAKLVTGDYLELYVENTTSDANITMEDTSLSVGQTS